MEISIFSEWQYSVVNEFIHRTIEEAKDEQGSTEERQIVQEQGS